MLNFVDIDNQVPFQERHGAPDNNFGSQIAFASTPLDFQYKSTEAVTSFQAIRLDAFGQQIEAVSLSISLITSTGTMHLCDGQTNYSVDLECGDYYFLVNSHYKSETFKVITGVTQGVISDNPIHVSGLEFYDNTKQRPLRLRGGAPDLTFGVEFSSMTNILPFRYLSSEVVSSFDLIQLDVNGQIIATTSLSASLVNADGEFHYNINSAYSFNCGFYFFRINGRYESEVFRTVKLEEITEQGIGFDIIEDTLIVY